MKINVAIDGPAGAGKSTVAQRVANALGYIYVDTGAMYRAVTWKALESGLNPQDRQSVIQLASGLDIRLIPGECRQDVLVDGENVTESIRTSEVNQCVSVVSQIGEVRERMTRLQKEMATAKGVVMDGRDIGTHVLPDAEVKIFLTAAVEERAARRFKEMREKGYSVTMEQLQRDIALRDEMDRKREVSPLFRAQDAILVETTKMTVDQVVEHILILCRSRMNKGI